MDNLTHSDDSVVPEVNDTPTPEHSELRAQDTILGLRREIDVLTARLKELESTEVATAFARVDQLEEEREASLRELRMLLKDYREQQGQLDAVRLLNAEQDARLQALVATEVSHRAQIDSLQRAVASLKASSTWKVGTAVIRPLSKIAGRLPR